MFLPRCMQILPVLALLLPPLAAAAAPLHAMTGGTPGVTSHVDRTVRVTATDTAFDVKQLDVRAGETVKFVVTNKGRVEHEFVLDDTRGHKAHEVEMSKMAGMLMDDDPNGISVAPGQTKTLVWKFAAAENIQFACDIPGHAEQGMKGDIVITGR